MVYNAKSYCQAKLEETRDTIKQLSHLQTTINAIEFEEQLIMKARILELKDEERRWKQVNNAMVV